MSKMVFAVTPVQSEKLLRRVNNYNSIELAQTATTAERLCVGV
jgi:hypothetical protein